MSFQRDAMRHLRRAGALLALALLASCGGGERVNPFVPQRVLSFGDENSVLLETVAGDQNGRKFTINTMNADNTAIACGATPIWNQYVAGAYGFVFLECSGAGTVTSSRILAKPNARVADMATQIDQFLAAGGRFTSNDLVTVLIGQNDVLDQYNAVLAGTVTAAQARANVEAAGAAAAAQVNRIATAGAKVLVSTIPDIGYAPITAGNPNLVALLSDRATGLTSRFNVKLRVNVIDDGHMIGIVLADSLQLDLRTYPETYGLIDLASAACTVALPDCNSTTLVSAAGGNPLVFLWADNVHFGALAQNQLGQSAVARATNNPF